MSTKINRRTIVRGAAWTAPAVLSSAIVPAYAASPTTATIECPTDYLMFPIEQSGQVSDSPNPSDNYYTVLAAYTFSAASTYQKITFTTSDPIIDLVVEGAESSSVTSDGQTATVLNSTGASEITVFITVKVLTSKTEADSNYSTSINFVIDGQCATHEGFNEFSNNNGTRN